MKTGVTAFTLSMGKGLVPFMFVYAPSLLLINFTWTEFSVALVSGILGIFALSVAFIGYFVRNTQKWENLLLITGGLFLVGNHSGRRYRAAHFGPSIFLQGQDFGSNRLKTEGQETAS